MNKPRIPIPDILLTSLAPMTWGTTYYVATEFLPPNHPLMAAALRSLPIGVLMTAWLRQLPHRDISRKLLFDSVQKFAVAE